MAKGASNTQVTGPIFDHTFGNSQGSYALLGNIFNSHSNFIFKSGSKKIDFLC